MAKAKVTLGGINGAVLEFNNVTIISTNPPGDKGNWVKDIRDAYEDARKEIRMTWSGKKVLSMDTGEWSCITCGVNLKAGEICPEHSKQTDPRQPEKTRVNMEVPQVGQTVYIRFTNTVFGVVMLIQDLHLGGRAIVTCENDRGKTVVDYLDGLATKPMNSAYMIPSKVDDVYAERDRLVEANVRSLQKSLSLSVQLGMAHKELEKSAVLMANMATTYVGTVDARAVRERLHIIRQLLRKEG